MTTATTPRTRFFEFSSMLGVAIEARVLRVIGGSQAWRPRRITILRRRVVDATGGSRRFVGVERRGRTLRRGIRRLVRLALDRLGLRGASRATRRGPLSGGPLRRGRARWG